MAKVRAVLFDVGGVLLTNGWDHEERARVLAHFSVDPAAYRSRHDLANDAWEKGLMTAEQFLLRTVFFEPRAFTPAEFLEQMRAQSRLLEDGAMEVLAELRAARECKLAVLNNEGRELNDFRIARFGLTQYFEAFFSSCYIGMRKPDENFYRLALDVLRVSPAEAAFIDDRGENCEAAAAVGLHAIRYQNPTQLRCDLQRLEI